MNMYNFLSWLTKPKGLVKVLGQNCVLLSSYMKDRTIYFYQVYEHTKYGIYKKAATIESTVKL